MSNFTPCYPTQPLEKLSMYKTKLSSRPANILFIVLEQNVTLKILSIEGNDITNGTCTFITNAMKLNDCLVELYLHFNPVMVEAISPISKVLEFNGKNRNTSTS